MKKLLATVIALGLATAAQAGVPGTWSPTGSMNEARNGATATLLPSGAVLIAGGRSSGVILGTAELYDPSRGTWTLTGSLNVARDNAAAILLPDGKVLVAGGRNCDVAGGDSLASCELYDSNAGTWTLTGNLIVGRSTHQAALLPDGTALVAGGWPNCSTSYGLVDAEMYDPGTGIWSVAEPLNTGRSDGPLVILSDGSVLIVGGLRCCPYVAFSSAEQYDHSTGAWMMTGSMNTARFATRLTLLQSGHVLVAGGGDTVGGNSAWSSVELYDPNVGTWTNTGSMANERRRHSMTLLPSGQVLVAGGHALPGSGLAELYDPETGQWVPTGSLNDPRKAHVAILLPNGKVLVAGGAFGSRSLASAELYTPSCPLDLDGDGLVGISDFLSALEAGDGTNPVLGKSHVTSWDKLDAHKVKSRVLSNEVVLRIVKDDPLWGSGYLVSGKNGSSLKKLLTADSPISTPSGTLGVRMFSGSLKEKSPDAEFYTVLGIGTSIELPDQWINLFGVEVKGGRLSIERAGIDFSKTERRLPAKDIKKRQDAPASKEDSTLSKNITADQVLLDLGKGNALQVGKLNFTLGGAGFQEDNRSFVRVFVCKRKSTAKLFKLSVGKAYLFDNGAERFKYLRDVDLSLSDKDICKLFGVNKKD